MSLFSKIGSFFKGVFNAAQRTYNRLPEDTKMKLVWGPGVIGVINEMAEDAPEKVLEVIQEKFPNIEIDKLEEGLFEIAAALKITKATSLTGLVAALQKHLNELEGSVWASVSHVSALILSSVFGGKNVKVGAIASLMEFIYQKFIKKAI